MLTTWEKFRLGCSHTAVVEHTDSMRRTDLHVSLRAQTTSEASDVTAGNRPSSGWAEDFPARGDLVSSRYARVVTTFSEPWHTNWLIIVNGLVSGTIGFKGEPVENRLEVGYGVVPSQRGRGVATAALTQLLALIEGRGLIVRAETVATNAASQSVLRHLSFEQVAQRHDDDGSVLIVWEREDPPLTPS